MSKVKIIKPKELDMSKVKYSDMKSLDNGAKIIYVNYINDNNPILLQTTECDLVFDAGWFPDQGDNSGKFSLKINLTDDNFIKKMDEFDKKIKTDAISKSKEWFKKPKLTKDAVDSMYNEMLKISTNIETGEPDGKYPPQFTYKIVIRNSDCLCKFYDSDKKKIVIDKFEDNIDDVNIKNMLVKGAKIKALIKCNGVWVSGNKFGCTWRAEQIMITVPEDLEDFAFRDSDDEQEGGSAGGGASKPVEEDEFVESDSEDSD